MAFVPQFGDVKSDNLGPGTVLPRGGPSPPGKWMNK